MMKTVACTNEANPFDNVFKNLQVLQLLIMWMLAAETPVV